MRNVLLEGRVFLLFKSNINTLRNEGDSGSTVK